MKLSSITSPKDIKECSIVELEVLAAQIRAFLLESLSKTGGHLSSNLGTVELTLALHRVFDAPEDRIIWDVGHQAYTHKILTGRQEAMATLRQFGGLSGFLKCRESEYDCFGAGHATTSLSSLLGFMIADKAQGKNNYHVAVIGDGALSGGMAFEAMNMIGVRKEQAMIILNDNEMSIGRNVGGLSSKLNQIRNQKGYLAIKSKVKPQLRPRVTKAIAAMKRSMRGLVMSSTLFEDLGIRYYGPIDGHDLEGMIEIMKDLKDYPGPVVLHVLTKKGKGYPAAEQDPNLYHGVGPFDPQKGITPEEKCDFSAVFGKKLLELARDNENIFAITAAMADGTGLKPFEHELPDRIIDVGIAEESALTMSTAMALAGLKPYVAIYSTFLQRAFDQMIHDMALHQAPVVLCIDRSGIVGADGETHQGIYDTAYLGIVPGLTVLAPMDQPELEAMLEASVDFPRPLAIKYPRGTCSVIKENPGNILENVLYEKGGKTLVISYGTMMESLLKLQEEIDFDLYNHRVVFPLRMEELKVLFKGYEKIIVVEECIYTGSLAEKIKAEFCENNIQTITLKDGFLEQGSIEELRTAQGLDAASIKDVIVGKGTKSNLE